MADLSSPPCVEPSGALFEARVNRTRRLPASDGKRSGSRSTFSFSATHTPAHSKMRVWDKRAMAPRNHVARDKKIGVAARTYSGAISLTSCAIVLTTSSGFSATMS